MAGASRGAGRGIALALGEAGATVYVTGRTVRGGKPPADGAPGTIEDIADEVAARGGRGIAVRVDHTREDEVAAFLDRVRRERKRLDLLAVAVWGGNEGYGVQSGGTARPFWELGTVAWKQMMTAGAYAHFLAATYAARLMARSRGGLIVHVTEPIIEKYDRGGPPFWALWFLGHRTINRMVEAMSPELVKRKVAIVALAPGWMRTERVLMYTSEKERKSARFKKSETPEYAGRAVASLAADPAVLERSGKLLFVGDLARQYGFKDTDGRYVPNFYRAVKLM